MDSHFRSELADVESRHWWYEGRRRILTAVLGRLDLPAEAHLLEAGCGSGANLSALTRFGTVSAFEPDPADRGRARSLGIGRVEHGALPTLVPFEGTQFDVILLADVLEHIADDGAALVALRDRLKTGTGRLIVTVPAHPWMWSAHDERNAHVRRYLPRTLRSVLRNAGFRVEHLSYFNMWLFPLIALARTLGRPFRMDRAGLSVPAGPINRFLTRLLASEARWVSGRGLPMGVSLLAVASLPDATLPDAALPHAGGTAARTDSF